MGGAQQGGDLTDPQYWAGRHGGRHAKRAPRSADGSGNRVVRTLRKETAHAVRKLANAAGRVLPEGHPLLAPWLMYVGRKPASGA